MSKVDDGFPAFPRSYVADGHNGMALRDWFATHASEEDIRCHRNARNDANGFEVDPPATREQARYRYADAMLKARKWDAS